MEVPQTPLHTSRVLKEEKDTWEDVKVRPPPPTTKKKCLLRTSPACFFAVTAPQIHIFILFNAIMSLFHRKK